MNEVWRDIPGFPGYQASTAGRVRSWRGLAPRVLEGGLTWANGRGGRYRQYTLSPLGEKQVTVKGHLLVLFAFVGPRPKGLETRHLNGDSMDNRLTNLAWGTHAENNQDRVRHGTHNYAAATHCKADHPFDDANTYVMPDGRRTCRACRARRERERYHRLRTAN